MTDAPIWLLAFAILATVAVLLERALLRAARRTASEPVARAMHPTAGEARVRGRS